MKKLVASEMITDRQFLCGILVGIYILIGFSYELNKASAYSTPAAAVLPQTMMETRTVEEVGESAVVCGLRDVVCDGEVTPVAAIAEYRPSAVVTVEQRPETQIDQTKLQTLEKVCKNSGLGERCAKVLYAMHLVETGGSCTAIGDQGRSYGCFQIQVKMHKVPKAIAMDFEKSAEWTLNNMVRHGLKNGLESYAVRRHNGDGPMSFDYLSKVKVRLAMIK